MKIALSMWSVHKYWNEKNWSVVDFIEFVGTTKARGVELLSIFWRDQEKELPLLKTALNKHHLVVSSYAACNNFVSKDREERRKQLKEVIDSIDMAVTLETNIVRVFTGDLPNDHSITYEEGMNYVLEGLTEASKYAEAKGVLLCIENHGLFAGKSEQVINIINEVGSKVLRSTFDTGNFLLVGENPENAIIKLKDYIDHVHIKDFSQSDTRQVGNTYESLSGELFLGKIPGDGDINLDYIISRLKENQYDGWLVVEFEGAEEPKLGSVKSVDYVQSLVTTIHTNA